jgi:hypothetical protein
MRRSQELPPRCPKPTHELHLGAKTDLDHRRQNQNDENLRGWSAGSPPCAHRGIEQQLHDHRVRARAGWHLHQRKKRMRCDNPLPVIDRLDARDLDRGAS